MAVTTASDRLAIEHQKDVAGVAGGVASAMIQTAMGADPAAISTWFFSALDGLMARIQAGYAINRRSAMGYLPQHGALNRVTVSPVPGSLDIGSSRARLNITGPVAFKRAIGAGFDETQALRTMATQMSGVADELVRNGDRDVITQTIRQGRGLVAYRRRLAGKSCGFCAMIASRGAVYTADTSTFRTHAHCRCWAEPVYRREREPVEVQRLQRQWSRVTAGKSGKDAQRAWRRHWEQRATPAARAREGIAELIPAPMAAAPGAVDPALKLTVAQLKTIANSNSVRIVGLRAKADVVAALRNHEDVHKVKLAGLPEWKPPRPVLGADIDAPPLGVPAADRVLTGAALKNWADYFKYDRELKRFQLVDAKGNTPPEGIRVHNLRANIQGGGYEYMVHDGTAFSFDGVAYLIEHRADQFGSPWVSRTLADLRAAHEDIPAAKLANKSYAALGGDNPSDAHWRVKYNNPDHTSIAMAGDGNVTLWQFRGPVSVTDRLYSRVPIDTLRHETGHNLDDLVGRTAKGSESAAWRDAARADASAAAKIRDLSDEIPGHGDFAKVEAGRGFPEGVTDYGRSSVVEDYAESVRLYQQGVIAQGRLTAGAEKGPVWFRDLYPERARILDDLFPDLAKAQKAEIAARRAPKPAMGTPSYVQRQAALRAASGDPELTRLDGGISAGTTLRTYPDGTRIVRKEYPAQDAVAAELAADFEELDARVLDAFGVRVPAVVRVNQRTIDMEFIEGRQGGPSGVLEAPASIVESTEGRRLGLADAVTGHRDRNGGNWLLTPDGHIVAIDNANAFEFGPQAASGNPFVRYLMTGREFKSNNLDPVELSSIRGRLVDLRPEFERLGRARSFEEMLTRFDDIAAKSTVPRPAVGAVKHDFGSLKVTELRALAKERGISGYSKLTKPQLLEKLGGKEVKAAVKAPEKDLVTLARQRQADIDYARARAELLSETEEWLNNQGTMASMAIQLRRDALRYGIEGHKDMAALFRAIDAGDEAKVRKAIEAAAKKQKLTRIDRAGDVVKFDRSLHGDIGKDLKPGEWAIVVRPGYSFDRNGELIRLHKAKVEKATAQEIAGAQAKRFAGRFEAAQTGDKALAQARIGQQAPGGPMRGLKTLSTAEREGIDRAVDTYISVDHVSINKFLRTGDSGWVGRPRLGEWVKNLDLALEHSTLKADVAAWRGLVDARPIFGDNPLGWAKDLSGFSWRDNGFVSTTTARHTASQLFASYGDTSVLLRLIVPKGIGAIQLSGAAYESELLLARGATFRVIADRVELVGTPLRVLDVEVTFPALK